MRMATEAVLAPRGLRRRRLLLAGASGLVLPGAAGGTARPMLRFASGWDAGTAHYIGVLARVADGFRVVHRLEVPSRAHDLCPLRDGSIVAVARRPGEWLVRWHPQRTRAQWQWSEPGRTFNGHLAVNAAGGCLLATETDADSGDGLVGRRNLATLALEATWHTHGRDPHMIIPDGAGWLVANGGILTLPETGRGKRELDRMDASLVRLDARGTLAGQWRLTDPRLSLRHLARSGPLVGVALQAEHDDAGRRDLAALLAVFDGQHLRAIDPFGAFTGGYAGDIAAWEATSPGFALGATRAGQVFAWDGASFRSIVRVPEACALTVSNGRVYAAGARHAARLPGQRLTLPPGMRLDNHWRPLSA